MRLTRTRFDDFRWAATSGTSKAIVTVALIVGLVTGGWALSPTALAWFYDSTGLVPAEVQEERDRVQELRLELSQAAGSAQSLVDSAPEHELVNGAVEELQQGIDESYQIVDDSEATGDDLESAISRLSGYVDDVESAIEAYDQHLLDEAYDQLQATFEDAESILDRIEGKKKYKDQEKGLKAAMEEAEEALESRDLDLTEVHELRTELTTAIEAAEERIKEVREEREREQQRREEERNTPAPTNPPGNNNNNSNNNPPPTNPPGNNNPQPTNPPSTNRASTSISLTCSSRETVTFTASGGGSVQLSVSGASSGSNRGSGSASVTVTGQGSFSATATADGTVAISVSATATCR